MLAEAVLKRLLDLDAGDLDTEVFRRRADAFLFQRLAGRRVEIDVAGHTVATGRSDRTGHFQAQIDLDDEVIAAAEGVLPCVARLRPAAGDPPSPNLSLFSTRPEARGEGSTGWGSPVRVRRAKD